MEIIRSPAAMTAWSTRRTAERRTIALVPTMGSFHQGHLSLMRFAARHGDCVVVSIFVNPIQFGPAEDLDRYPRDLQRDAELARQEKIDLIFAPEAADMYPPGFQTRVGVTELGGGLCGACRPGHFDGVATVVAKLFNIVQPHLAVFGEKDLQQLAVIRRLVADLNWNIEICGHPIVREPDGLAMSSRNAYLSAAERQAARRLHLAIRHACGLVEAGLTEAGTLRLEVEKFLTADPAVQSEYVVVIDQDTLMPQDKVNERSRLALAAKIGRTRLIDNGTLGWPSAAR
jgi:pantoate--beta-alanine ligase